jgi:hypothetical protein
MKRPHVEYAGNRSGDILHDLTEKQLAGVGSVALAYNEAEVLIDALLSLALGLWPNTALELTSRINGIDGKIELAKIAMRELGAAKAIQDLLSQSLGNDGFAQLKKYRDGVIHARITHAPAGIAVTPGKRGRTSDVLLTVKALAGLYERLRIIRFELAESCNIAVKLFTLRKISEIGNHLIPLYPPSEKFSDLTKASIEQDIEGSISRYVEYQKQRLSLAPLPEFPSEDEMHEAQLEWLKDRGLAQTIWLKQFSAEPKRAFFPPFGPPPKK